MKARPSVSLRTLLLISHLAVLVLPVAALVGTGALARDLIDQRHGELGRQAELLALLVQRAPEGELQPLLADVFDRTQVGVRVVDARGVVIATSGPRLGEDLSDRPEVRAALAGEPGIAMREEVPVASSHPKARRAGRAALRWLYRSAPVRDADGRVTGAVLAMRPVREVLDAFEDMWGDLGWGLGAALFATFALAVGAAQVLSRSLRALARASGALADGRPPPLPGGRASRIAEVHAVATDLRRMAERLQARLRDNRDFAGHVAHEFKTPLTTLTGTVELLLTDAEMPADQRERFLRNARVDLDRLARMVDGLLALARAEESARREPVDLDALLDLAAARHGAAREGHAGTVSGDPTQLEVAAANLVENARRHGGPTVVVRGWRDGAAAGFTVEDDGPGIRPAILPQVFERFFTTGAERTGTGLGLPIVRAVCEAHGGDVAVESGPGRTVFRVRLPA